MTNEGGDAEGLGGFLEQAQRLQQRLASMQEEAANKQVEGSAGGGAVTVVVNGLQQVLSVKIDPETVDPKDTEMLQDLIVAATNVALDNAREMMSDEMSRLTGGLQIPGLF